MDGLFDFQVKYMLCAFLMPTYVLPPLDVFSRLPVVRLSFVVLFYCSVVIGCICALVAGSGRTPVQFECWNSSGLYLPCTEYAC